MNTSACNHLAASFQKCRFHADMDQNLNILTFSDAVGEIKQIAQLEIWFANVLRYFMCESDMCSKEHILKKFRKYKSALMCKIIIVAFLPHIIPGPTGDILFNQKSKFSVCLNEGVVNFQYPNSIEYIILHILIHSEMS